MTYFTDEEVTLMHGNLMEMLETRERLWSEVSENGRILCSVKREQKPPIRRAIAETRELAYEIEARQSRLEDLVSKINHDVYETWRFRSNAYERCRIFQDAIDYCVANLQLDDDGNWFYEPLERKEEV